MAFGAYLGLVNQAATGVSAMLRAPALIAALILVAQSIHEVQQYFSHRDHDRHDHHDRHDSGHSSHSGHSGEVVTVVPVEIETPGRAVHRDAQVVARPSSVPVREKPSVIYFVMGLAVWLGLASLANPTAPRMLLVMSLLAAFLLFSEAWQMLRQSPD
jgi:hypothetical protein